MRFVLMTYTNTSLLLLLNYLSLIFSAILYRNIFTMSWIPEKRFNYSWLDSLLLRVLKCGQVPRHVAFIMDGNRRFARQRKIDKIQGHTMGFDKLAETLQWCHDMEIKEVTVYAFRWEGIINKAYITLGSRYPYCTDRICTLSESWRWSW